MHLQNVSGSAKTFGASCHPWATPAMRGLLVFCLNDPCRACKRLEPSKQTKFLRYSLQTPIFLMWKSKPELQPEKLLFDIACTWESISGQINMQYHSVAFRTALIFPVCCKLFSLVCRSEECRFPISTLQQKGIWSDGLQQMSGVYLKIWWDAPSVSCHRSTCAVDTGTISFLTRWPRSLRRSPLHTHGNTVCETVTQTHLSDARAVPMLWHSRFPQNAITTTKRKVTLQFSKSLEERSMETFFRLYSCTGYVLPMFWHWNILPWQSISGCAFERSTCECTRTGPGQASGPQSFQASNILVDVPLISSSKSSRRKSPNILPNTIAASV